MAFFNGRALIFFRSLLHVFDFLRDYFLQLTDELSYLIIRYYINVPFQSAHRFYDVDDCGMC